MPTATSEDTEITLGTGKMLALFFGLVVICALFFSMGFSMGKNSAKPAVADAAQGVTVTTGGTRPTAVKNSTDTAPPTDMTFYKAVADKNADSQLTPAQNKDNANPPDTALDVKNASADPTAAPATSGYYVQVAAVSKQEDAEALVEALKKKDY